MANEDSRNPLAAVGAFVTGVTQVNTEALRRFMEIQGDGMKAYADANRVLLEALRDSKSMTDAAAAQKAYFEAISGNAQAAMMRQLELAKDVGSQTQALFGSLTKKD